MKLVTWNVRGMNSVSKRAVMKGVIRSCKGECVFIQETKMEVIENQVINSFCPWSNGQFVMGPSIGSAGGILLVWNAAFGIRLMNILGKVQFLFF